jgi:hypothetical protein
MQTHLASSHGPDHESVRFRVEKQEQEEDIRGEEEKEEHLLDDVIIMSLHCPDHSEEFFLEIAFISFWCHLPF